jgi:putative oxidoreductase
MLERSSHYAALPLRIVLGCSFVVLGLQKLAGYFDGPGLARTAELMATGGLTPGTFWAWIVGVLELLGGAAIVLGLLTRWAALVLALESLAATIAGWQLTNVEFRLAALAAFVALALLGPQRYALDLTSRPFRRIPSPIRLKRLVSGGASLVTGTVIMNRQPLPR